MSKGWLLFWTAFSIGCAVNDFSTGHNASGTFEIIMGIGVGLNLLKRTIEEDE